MGERYEIMEQIGQGGMAKIYKVKDMHLKKYWALKIINLEGWNENTNDFEKKLLKNSVVSEMEILKNLEHSALPKIVDYFREETKIYIVIDYIEGENLKEKVIREGPQEEGKVLEWALELCDVLGYLHERNIIYRDLKPSNLMINVYGKLKLIDFGTARNYKENNNQDTTYLGTMGYAAPEQFGGKGQTDVRSDIYSFGATLCYLLSGGKRGEEAEKIIFQNCSEKMNALIRKCMQIEPMNRYQFCEEVKIDLLECKKIYENVKNRKCIIRKKCRKKNRRSVRCIICIVIIVIFGSFYCEDRQGSIVQSSFCIMEKGGVWKHEFMIPKGKIINSITKKSKEASKKIQSKKTISTKKESKSKISIVETKNPIVTKVPLQKSMKQDSSKNKKKGSKNSEKIIIEIIK